MLMQVKVSVCSSGAAVLVIKGGGLVEVRFY